MADPYGSIGAAPDAYSGIGAAPDPYAHLGTSLPAPPAAPARAPGASGLGMVSQTFQDLTDPNHPNHDPNALEQGVMNVAFSKPVQSLKANYDQAVDSGLFMQSTRAVMEGLGVGRQPGESDASLHARYSAAVQASRQDAQQRSQQNTVGAYDGDPVHVAERAAQQVGNLGAGIVANPQYFLLPGGGGGGSVGARIAQAGAVNAGIGSASDAAAQLMDMAEGDKKNFDITQNLQQAVVGGAFGAGLHGTIEVAPYVKGLFANRGMDTTPAADPRQSTIQPMTSDHVALNAADHMQLQQLMQTGSVDDIKGFFADKQGPRPSWSSVNRFVEQRDNPDFDGQPKPVANPRSEGGQPFNYNDQYNAQAEQQYAVANRQAVQDHVDSITSGWKNAPPIEVVHGPADIADPEIRQQAMAADAPGGEAPGAKGFYGADGITRMYSGRVGSTEAVNALLYHEGLGHYGLAQKFGDKLDSVLQSMLDRNVNQFSRDTDQWMQDHPGAYGGDRLRAAEEVLAERSEKGVTPKSWRDAVTSSIMQFGRKMGLKLAYSDAEVNNILAMAHDAVVKGTDARNNGFSGNMTGDNKFMFTGPRSEGYNPRDPSAYRARDGVVRNEIDDSSAQIKSVPPHSYMATLKPGEAIQDTLGGVLHHPKLFERYPELKDLPVYHTDLSERGLSGAYSPTTREMFIDPSTPNLRDTVLHETQHAIQHIEGYPNAERGSLHLSGEDYFKSPLEKEAYATEDRQGMSQAQRNANPPKFMRADALGREQVDPEHLDDIDRLKTDPRYLSDQEFRQNVNEMARVRATQEEQSGNKFMRGPSDPENKDYGRLPITDKDIRISRNLHGMIMHHDDPNGLNRFSDIDQIRDRYAREYGDVPPEQVDRIVRDYRNMNVGQEHPDLAKTINVYDNTRGEIIKKFDNRRDALAFIDAQPNRQNLGIDRYGTDNKFMRASADRASTPGYRVDDLEKVYHALEEGYTPTTRTWEQEQSDALAKGFSPAQLRAIKELGPGELSNRMYRLNSAANMTFERLSELNEKLDSGAFTEKDQAAYLKTMADMHYLTVRIKGERAEIARAQNVARAAGSYSVGAMEQMRQLLEQNGSGLAGLAADPTAFFKFARGIKSMMQGGNPAGAMVKIQGVNQPYWEQYLNTAHMNMMLSALSTHVKAPVDMATGIVRNVIEKAVAMPIGRIRQTVEALTGRPVQPGVEAAELGNHLAGMLGAITDAEVYKAAWNAAKTGQSSYVIDGQRTPTNFANQFGAQSNPRLGAGPGTVSDVLNKPTDLISAQDTYFRSVEINGQLRAIATREARAQLGPKATTSDVMTLGKTIAQNPTPSMLKEAYDLTNRTLLLNDNPLNNVVNRLRMYRPGMNPAERFGAFFANLLMPFIRVESNSLINRVLTRSPLGLLNYFNAASDLRAGGAKADIAMSKIVYGTLLLGMYWSAAGQGKTTGDGPGDVNQYKEKIASGWRPNAVHEDDGRYVTGGNQLGMSINPFDYHNKTAQMVASVREAYDAGANGGQVATGLKLALGSLGSNLVRQSWASDIDPTLSAVTAQGTDAQSKVQGVVNRQAQSWIPNIFSQVAKVTDGVQRDTSAPNNISQGAINNMQSEIPGARQGLPVKYSVYGQPLQQGNSWSGEHVPILGLSGNQTTQTNDPTEMELDRLNTSLPDIKATLSPSDAADLPKTLVTPVQRTFKLDDGTSRTLTTPEFEEYQHLAGVNIVEAVRQEMSTSDWQSMSDHEKVLRVRDIESDMKASARKALFDQ